MLLEQFVEEAKELYTHGVLDPRSTRVVTCLFQNILHAGY